uniref:CD79a molecule, immunoglobulin-associated alpha n=1 Tax=Gasterosteus aculeatus aculeatus TaxID=481459 RepID=G3NFW9_GASAC|nr:B-cell antigen receptor complex-associated protein alpha chain [Gasterosteus aculeatus aculeatus]
MGTIINFLLCTFVVAVAQAKLRLEADRPFLRVQVGHTAELECCYRNSNNPVKWSWIKRAANGSLSEAPESTPVASSRSCGTLTLELVQLKDSGFYQCSLKSNDCVVMSHGTYLQVYKPMEKIIQLSESTKNKILTAEGVLLLLCVIVPSVNLLCQSRRLHELEKKKAMKEEENIYQGLNLDECWSAYDQIQRCEANGPYEDVGNLREEEEEIQLEKP